jgi:hypothetical protein
MTQEDQSPALDEEEADKVGRFARFTRKILDRKELSDDAKMLLGSILETSDRAKNETVRLVAREVRTYLEELKLKELLESIMEGHTLDVKASFRLRKNDSSQGKDEAEVTDEAEVELELGSATEDEDS